MKSRNEKIMGATITVCLTLGIVAMCSAMIAGAVYVIYFLINLMM